MFITLLFNTYYSMFYNHNSNLNKWFVSPYLTISKGTSICFLDKMVMIMKRTSIKNFFKKSKKKKNLMGWNIRWVGVWQNLQNPMYTAKTDQPAVVQPNQYFLSAWISLDPWLPIEDSARTLNKTVWLHRLIRVFRGYGCDYVGFVVLRLK